MQSRLVRTNLALTAMFIVTVVIAIPTRHHRSGQVLIAVVSLVLFAIGIATSIWAYAAALDRSRVEEVGVANLYLLTGNTAPPRVKRAMSSALGAQVVAAMVGAWVGVVGLSGNQINALAFGVLVPMLGIGMNGAWAARYGSYGPRVNIPSTSSKRRNG
jgi:hypothetical protein